MNSENQKLYGTYDVIVSGGGLSGVACAVTLARAGRKVALVERRSALGWEIGRTRIAAAQLDQLPPESPLVGELAEQLNQYASEEGGGLASVAELLLDQWTQDAGIDVMFHGWSAKVESERGSITGLTVGTREGYRLLEAPVIIETDDCGPLIDSNYGKTPLPQRVYRVVYMRNVPQMKESMALAMPDGRKMMLFAETGSRARLWIELSGVDEVKRDHEFHTVIPNAVRWIREHAEGCAESIVEYWAEEEWASSAWRLEDGFSADHHSIGECLESRGGVWSTSALKASDLSASVHRGLYFAGAWLPKVMDTSPTLPDERSQAGFIWNRISLGEGAAKLVLAASYAHKVRG